MSLFSKGHRVLFGLYMLLCKASAAYSNFTTTCEDPVLHTSRLGHLSLLSASCVTTTEALNSTKSTNSTNSTSSTNNTDSTATPLLHNSTLDLNLCLGIDDSTAVLTWSIYGKFSLYCSSCHVVGRTSLGCSCATLSGVKANSTIDLDSGISNSNGTLSCLGGIGMDN
ncbi:hypothetical protein HMPREF1624_07741 [Sporothrix schenckii ATCC 58251]|uniref:Cyanovirin-N domain-containing protein n=1 Tax=Sporothrix schenckii (strain ATCC 58251 / de Perez 2211183) TaxID=1391915 RepID=U7PJF0_SPOS1|nr:hypothetical protein HMPREF1624_07741 [Sporothrix schenckii ATCC 58251]